MTLYCGKQIQRCFTEAWQPPRPVFSVSGTDVPSSSCSRHLPISNKQISGRCKHRESNSINNGARLFLPPERSGKLRSAPRIAPERTQLFSLSGALKSISDYRVRGGMGKSGARKLPVIWRLKAIGGGDGSGCNQGVGRPSAYDCEEHDGYLRVAPISSRGLLSSQQNSQTKNSKLSQPEIGI